jgi:2-oxo-4-hydroxy-4-carboxy-5-ureidoimidazoline decarboxylase
LSSIEYTQFQHLNQAYQTKFDFPFIVAVKNHTKQSILAAFDRRLQNSVDEELATAIEEINQIARFRLLAIVDRVETHIS